MYNTPKQQQQTLKGIKAYRAESIEDTLARMISNKEPIQGQITPIYTDRSEGVKPDYDIRTDKFEFLVESTNAMAMTKRATRDNIGKLQDKIDNENKNLNGGESPEVK